MDTCELTIAGDTRIVTAAPNAFRHAKQRRQTHQVLEHLITKGSRKLIIDLSQVKPPFDDQGAFGPIMYAYGKSQTDIKS